MAAPPIAVLFGTRPEAIKLAPVIVELRSRDVPTLVIATGQHRDIVDQVLDLFDIRPDHDLALMKEGQTLDHVLSSVVSGVGTLLADAQPRAMLVQGDTTSTLGGAIAAFHHRVPVGHVEAGLRSGSLDLPFPEEMNRRVTSIVTRWHFPPTEGAAANLRARGSARASRSPATPSSMPCATSAAGLPRPPPSSRRSPPAVRSSSPPRIGASPGTAGSSGSPGRCVACSTRCRTTGSCSPRIRTRSPAIRCAGSSVTSHEPAWSPRSTIRSSSACSAGRGCAITDSGGVQEEGPTLGVPVLVTRQVTERPEGVDAGAVILVGTDPDRIRTLAVELLTDDARHEAMASRGRGIYGDGRASERIVDRLLADLPAVP